MFPRVSRTSNHDPLRVALRQVATAPQHVPRQDGAHRICYPSLPEDADLAGIVAAWSTLPEDVRQAMISLISASARPTQ